MALNKKLQTECKMTSVNVSFEFLPPKTIELSCGLEGTFEALAPLGPRFVSLTSGFGGTTRQLTLETRGAFFGARDLSVTAHLTCLDTAKEKIPSLRK